LTVSSCRRSSHPRRLIVKDNRNSIRKEVLHLIKFVKKTVAIPAIRTRKKILALSLKQNGLIYIPISLLNLSSKEIGPGQKVTGIFSEDLTSGELKMIMEVID
ncbi:hypothetical protein U0C78_09080, partial [Enterococcus durans]